MKGGGGRTWSLATAGMVAAMVLAPAEALAVPPSVVVSLSATAFRVGDTLTVGISAANPLGNPPAALFVGVVLPDGVTVRQTVPSPPPSR